MKKLLLTENHRQEIINYTQERMGRCSHIKNYDYITEEILNNVFDFFLKNRLTVEENAKSYFYKNSKKEILCYGYSGCSIKERDNFEGMKENLFHEIFCKTEWAARSKRETYYIESVKAFFGRSYNKILA